MNYKYGKYSIKNIPAYLMWNSSKISVNISAAWLGVALELVLLGGVMQWNQVHFDTNLHMFNTLSNIWNSVENKY